MLGSDPLMARHRKRPGSRQEAFGRDGVPAASEAPESRLGPAMRRVVVTPTFAAGLGVVVAAVLAYPMQTVFSYVAPGALGRGGLVCDSNGCSHQPVPNGKADPFGTGGSGALGQPQPGSAKQDNDGAPSASKPAGSGGGTSAKQDNDGAPSASKPAGSGGTTTAARPQLSYKITSKWQGGFWGQITITFPGAVPASWSLRFGYPGGHILGMNPDSHLAPNGHAVTVRSTDYSGGAGPGGRTFAVGVGVQGMPTHPARCTFDGRACHIR
jgi:hypothetical protein